MVLSLLGSCYMLAAFFEDKKKEMTKKIYSLSNHPSVDIVMMFAE